MFLNAKEKAELKAKREAVKKKEADSKRLKQLKEDFLKLLEDEPKESLQSYNELINASIAMTLVYGDTVKLPNSSINDKISQIARDAVKGSL